MRISRPTRLMKTSCRPISPVTRWAAHRLEAWAYRRAAHVIALSPGMAVSLQFHDARARALIDGTGTAPKRKPPKDEKKQGTLL